ncbi:odorant receptor 33a-like isoform X2 [Hermetia illucens]|uniref:odorant receptor 33a-like isoform X2 n=1 Tax=Hermetia illucens TaxID=343691 RepID=UPI0018CC388F|nr:odorant receptor 33a-like isoform X2 [Hermetia illucens]
MFTLINLKTSRSFRYWWLCCKILGLHPPNSYRTLYFLYSFLINFSHYVVTPISYVVYFIYESQTIHELFQAAHDFLSFMAVNVKVIVLLSVMEKLQTFQDAIDALEMHPKFSTKDNARIAEMILAADRLMLCFVCCFNLFVLLFVLSTLLSAQRSLLLPMWIPFDWNSSGFVYWSVLTYQFFIGLHTVNRNISTDAFPPLYLLALCGHFDILADRFKDIGCNSNQTAEGNCEELVDCIKTHGTLMSVFDQLASIISKTIICQFLLSALTISIALVPVFIMNLSTPQIIMSLSLCIALVFQILPSCYYGDKFMEKSEKFTTCLYSCNWLDQSLRFKRTLFLFMTVTVQDKVILVGKLAPINLITLLKFFF